MSAVVEEVKNVSSVNAEEIPGKEAPSTENTEVKPSIDEETIMEDSRSEEPSKTSPTETSLSESKLEEQISSDVSEDVKVDEKALAPDSKEDDNAVCEETVEIVAPKPAPIANEELQVENESLEVIEIPAEKEGSAMSEEVAEGEIVEEDEDAFVDDDDEQFSSAESEISKKSSNENSRSSTVDGDADQREDGDGEEEEEKKKEKKVDQAEDRRNPQYIPRRGVFYEHDDRTLEDEANDGKKEPEPPQKANKKAASSDAVEKWGHDLFDEIMQSPKSTDELIEAYGYDIRKEDGPPKARRSRHYGKGPNKYQRSWEDEQAYNKSSGFRNSRKPPFRNSRPKNFTNREEDFPSLSPGNAARNENNAKNNSWSSGRDGGRSNRMSQSSSNDYDKPSRGKQVTFQDKNVSPGRRGHGIRHGGGEFRKNNFSQRNSSQFAGHSSNKDAPKDKFENDDIATLAQHFSNAVINVDKKNIVPINKGPTAPASTTSAPAPQGAGPKSAVSSYSNADGPAQQGQQSEQGREDRSDPAGSQQEKAEVTAKSKRYSTQRQRSMPLQPQMTSPMSSTTTPPPAPPQLHPPATTSPNANYLPHPPPNFFPAPPPPTTCLEPPPFQPPPPPGAMVTFIPNVNPPAFQPPPPQYIPQYMAVPSHVAAGPPPPPPGAPPEVYQGGGITYYNTQSQIPPRQTQSRRIKLAIPIVAPDSQQGIQ